jgi:hypothetical protein
MNILRNMLTLSLGLWLSSWAWTAATAHPEIGISNGSVSSGCRVPGCAGTCRHCAKCGCEDGCLVCRLEPDEKKIKATCYAVECKPICLPNASQRGCRHEEIVDCSKDGAPGSAKKFVWFDWCPGTAHVQTPKHLMKKTTEKKVPSYKWVVENLCEKCQRKCQQETIPAGADVPTPPRVAAKIRLGVPAVAAISSSDP